jgi:hypothetical protein
MKSIIEGRARAVNILDEMPEPGAVYVMDRAYVNFERFFFLTLSFAFSVVRTKANGLLQRRYSHKVDKSTGVRSEVVLYGFRCALSSISFEQPCASNFSPRYSCAPIALRANFAGVKNLRSHLAHDAIAGTLPSYRTTTKRRSVCQRGLLAWELDVGELHECDSNCTAIVPNSTPSGKT